VPVADRLDLVQIAAYSSGMSEQHYDWVIVGSGFGGSVSAHRLTQKGYKVLVIEKGRRFAAEDFPKTNCDLK